MTLRTETYEAHGGPLVDLLVPGSEADALRERADSLPVARLSSRSLSDLELLAVGGYSPLEGFMTQADYRSVVTDMHLASGLPWPMPITLAVSTAEADSIAEGSEIALSDENGTLLATMQVEQKFGYDVWYVDNVSLAVDIRILLKTLTSVASLRGITPDDSASMPVFRGSKL